MNDRVELTTVVCLRCGTNVKAVHPGRKMFCSDRCKSAYRRSLEHPPPTYVGDVALLPANLSKHFTVGDPDDCWVYARRQANGYAAATSINNFKGNAYRLLYLLMVGPIPGGMETPPHLRKRSRRLCQLEPPDPLAQEAAP